MLIAFCLGQEAMMLPHGLLLQMEICPSGRIWAGSGETSVGVDGEVK